jgi:hypothetical protein
VNLTARPDHADHQVAISASVLSDIPLSIQRKEIVAQWDLEKCRSMSLCRSAQISRCLRSLIADDFKMSLNVALSLSVRQHPFRATFLRKQSDIERHFYLGF